MRILQINISATSGSVGKIVNNLYWSIRNRGHICKVAYGKGNIGNIPVDDTYRISSTSDMYAHAALSRIKGGSGFYSVNATKKFLKWVDQYNPDIIHLHGAYGYYLNMQLLFEYIANKNKKLISTLHSCWDFTGHCCYFDYPSCIQWKSGCNKCIRMHDYPECWLYDNTHKNYIRKKELYNAINNITIVTPSNWLADLAKQSFLSNKHIMCIHNGIDTKIYRKNKVEKNHTPMILCVANVWSKRKGLDDIIQLASFLDGAADILIVGLNSNQIKKLPYGIKGITRTENMEELIDLYNRATILFNPTYEENYPTVNLEAVACHLPVATYDTGGCKETICNEKYGKLINKKDYKSLKDYLMDVIAGNIKYNYEDISFLDSTTMLNSYFSLYESMEE